MLESFTDVIKFAKVSRTDSMKEFATKISEFIEDNLHNDLCVTVNTTELGVIQRLIYSFVPDHEYDQLKLCNLAWPNDTNLNIPINLLGDNGNALLITNSGNTSKFKITILPADSNTELNGYALRKVYFTDIDLSQANITSIGPGAFEGCTRFTEIDIPEGVEYLNSQCFRECISLKRVRLPKSLSTSNIGYGIFEGCEDLEVLEVPKESDMIDENGNLYNSDAEYLGIKNKVKIVTY